MVFESIGHFFQIHLESLRRQEVNSSPNLSTPSAGSAVHPEGKILKVLQISNIRLRLRHNEKTDLFTIGEQYSLDTKKGVTEYPPEKVIDSYTDSDEAIVAFIR